MLSPQCFLKFDQFESTNLLKIFSSAYFLDQKHLDGLSDTVNVFYTFWKKHPAMKKLEKKKQFLLLHKWMGVGCGVGVGVGGFRSLVYHYIFISFCDIPVSLVNPSSGLEFFCSLRSQFLITSFL